MKLPEISEEELKGLITPWKVHRAMVEVGMNDKWTHYSTSKIKALFRLLHKLGIRSA